MNTYTNLAQSKQLAKKLPWTSADAYYINGDPDKLTPGRWVTSSHDGDDIPAWSLSALYSILPVGTSIRKLPRLDDVNSVYVAEYLATEGWSTKISTAAYLDPLNAACELVARVPSFDLAVPRRKNSEN